jgi:hypothetical protein
MLTKLKMCINLKSLSGFTLLDAILQKIQLTKEIFMLDIEDGLEIFIPRELS